ncbi:cell wall hydrolase [Dongia sp.]|uniref:cell wall hydrolase n=1 Tax=Dongia sp. TaxID=1977262 RepID=UPI0035B07591
MKIQVTARDKDIAARTLFGEGRGESRAGRIAILWVIRNRAEADLGNDGKPDWWGEGVAGVCQKQNARGVHQFSCWNIGDPNLKRISSVQIGDPVFRECLQLVDEVFSDKIPDPTKSSTHYHTRAIMPAWAKGVKPAAAIGAHLFYNSVK